MKNLTGLDLWSNALTSLPPEIGQLKNLTVLNFQGSPALSLASICKALATYPKQIIMTTESYYSLGDDKNILLVKIQKQDSLPAEIGQLKNLTSLDLSYNRDLDFADVFKKLGRLENLTKLNLNSNKLTSLPPEIGQLKNLTKLSLEYNQLTTLPSEIGQLKNLTEMILSKNKLTSLPPEIGQLKNLTKLNLRSSKLTSLPPEIGQLQNLTKLILEYNQLTTLQSEIGQLQNLTTLYLYNNQLTSLPAEVGRLQNLMKLDLNSNQLTSLPAEIGQLTNLTSLDLRDNQLTSLPPEIAKLINLNSLFLKNNNFKYFYEGVADLLLEKSKVSSSLVNKLRLSELSSLDLQERELSSLLPITGQLKSLKSLIIQIDKAEQLSPEIANTENLETLRIKSSSLIRLPKEFSELKQLRVLDIKSCNRLDFSSLCDVLKRFDQFLVVRAFYSSSFSNSPSSYGKDTLLVLTPPQMLITEEVSQLNNLVSLYISSNQASKLPEQIASLDNLQKIYIDYEPIYGSLPKGLATFLENRTNLGSSELDILLNTDNLDKFSFTYRLENSFEENQTYYRQYSFLEYFLSNYLILGLMPNTSEEEFKQRLEQVGYDENDLSQRNNFYFDIEEVVFYDKRSNTVLDTLFELIHSGYVNLYYRLPNAESYLIGKYRKKSLADNLFFENLGAIWINPFDYTDQRYYHRALYTGLYTGKLVAFKDLNKGVEKQITSKQDLDSIANELRSVPALLTKLKDRRFKPDKAQQTARDTLWQGYETYYANTGGFFISKIWYEPIDQEEQKILASNLLSGNFNGIIRSYQNDSLRSRAGDEEFKNRIYRIFLKENEEQISSAELSAEEISYEQLNILVQKLYNKSLAEVLEVGWVVPLCFSTAQNRIYTAFSNTPDIVFDSTLNTYSAGHRRDANAASVNLYIGAQYTASGKRELIATFSMKEVWENLINDNPDFFYWDMTKIRVRAVGFQEPTTGERKEVSSAKDLKILKKQIPVDGQLLKNSLYKPLLSDFDKYLD
ncbi:MAG: leucine-rich repeat domain-containing protein [Bernardetiaceae bacterium]|nr:leucine-rich repeat domain-containing protein [Bernardetiaceae bacterium]